MKLTKEEQRMHREACALVKKRGPLTEDEKDIVLNHWQESSTTSNALDGAYFTPEMYAWDFRLEVNGARIIDLCAGIGRLANAALEQRIRTHEGLRSPELVCVERNPVYVEVGRKVVPEATWICADVLEVGGMGLGRFDTAMANPPFGRIERSGNGPRYRGPNFEFHVIDVASRLARRGAFIIPQMSAPFRNSGQPFRVDQDSTAYERFHRETGITLVEGSLCMDTAFYDGEWRGVSPRTEVVVCDFEEKPEPPQRTRMPRPAPVREPVPVVAAHADGMLF
ncbi:methyltransferase [Streptomyces sp. NPDC006655]|uniref:methyltransferase n=1 Tax=Streptomyces sp. NPDC006655 TaxID=3156898 RepID=UPI0034518705